MDKLRTTSPDLTDANVDKLADIFPTVVTETLDDDGSPVKAINFDLLRQELTNHLVEGPHERYQLDWPGKRAAAFVANTPIAKTLRPVRDESFDFDTTKNLFIEGDNLDALKLLQESYLGKIQLAYIDPPYNTGNDFIYNDDFMETAEDYLLRSGQADLNGAKLVANPETNGRFHSDWLSMLYPRLKLARNLLRPDGLLCASIDGNEVHNLRKLGDEVFGASNFIGEIAVAANPRGRQSDSYIAGVHDSLLVWARDRRQAKVGGRPLDPEQKKEFNQFDETLGHYRLLGLRQRGSASRRIDRPDMYYPIYVSADGTAVSVDPREGWHEVLPRKSDGTDGRWMWGRDKCRRDNALLAARWIERRGEYDVFVKDPLVKGGSERLRKFKSVWDGRGFNNQNGTQEVKALLGGDYMSFPKPVQLMREVVLLGAPEGGTVLDFFAGSSSMAHAVMQVNQEDGRARPFIMVQLDEALDESSDAGKAGYRTVAALSRERIRRAGAKVLKDAGLGAEGLDVGFRALRVDTTNMTDVLRVPDATDQQTLADMEDSVKPDRTGEDLLFQILIEWGLELAMPVVCEELEGDEVYVVDDGALIAFFGSEVSPDLVRAMARREPLRAVFRDSGFASDDARINAEQIFRELSPATDVKVI
ncbi:site-specific DNA-methyltransferase [Mycobacteroides abscessus]|uniref:site-specific DNA-methyltransferase n=1 Tax=Mycobacteroides abscessus TaxID=36809 RepID=UPI000C26750D|nr:site-specific DNA-methyltransferase [Mycobacteroides abscessus]